MKACIQKILVVFCTIMVLASVGYANDRERIFIDANGDTGYYVYMDNVKRPSYYEIVADIAIIKADENRLFLYETYFDTYHNYCRFQTSKVYQYSDKKMLMGSNTPQDLREYTSTSPMKAIADYLVENTKNLIPAGALPIPPGEENKEDEASTASGTKKPATKNGVGKKADKKTAAKKKAKQKASTKEESSAKETAAPEEKKSDTQNDNKADVQANDKQQTVPQPEKDSSERQKTDEEKFGEDD